MGRSLWGTTHGGVRWKTLSWPHLGLDRAGRSGSREAPVPTTATRLPSRSWSWSHCAEWKTRPAKRSRPGMSGSRARAGGPLPATRTCGGDVAVGGLDASSAGCRRPTSALRTSRAEADVRAGRRTARRSRAGSRGSRLPAGTCATSSGWARRRTSRGATGRRTGTPGIGVVAPGAADVVGLLEDDEVLDALLLEPDGHAEAARIRCR